MAVHPALLGDSSPDAVTNLMRLTFQAPPELDVLALTRQLVVASASPVVVVVSALVVLVPKSGLVVVAGGVVVAVTGATVVLALPPGGQSLQPAATTE